MILDFGFWILDWRRTRRCVNVRRSRILLYGLMLLTLSLPFTADAATWRFAPRQRVFRPLLADPGEPRFGIYRYLDASKLEGQIGGAFEAFNVTRTDGTIIQFGIHAGVFTLLGKNGNIFPLETADFLLSTHTDLQHGRLTGRFEFGHVSAHLADGFKNPARPPITYSREFFTLYGSYQFPHLRVYSSVRYLNHTIPRFPRGRVQAGGELESPRLFGHIPRVYLAYDIRVFKDVNVVANQTAQAGVSIHTDDHAGLRVALIGHTGRSEHGQFHDLADRFVGIGVFFDL